MKSSHGIDAEGVWCEILADDCNGGPVLFLDRDGVVVEEVDHLYRVKDVRLVSSAADVIGSANRCNIPVVLVTNQAGIGRGLYEWADFAAVQRAIIAELEARGARFDAVYACPHHPNGKGEYFHPDHPARKPNPGMILRAARDLGVDLRSSWLVGDKAIDVEAARRAGLAGAMQVMTGYGTAEWQYSAALERPGFEVRAGRSIADAASLPLFPEA